MSFVTTHHKIASSVSLHTASSLNITGYVSSMSIIPVTIASLSGQLYALCVVGQHTNWDENTQWSLNSDGPELMNSTRTSGGPTFMAWALMIGNGNGSITISDGSISATIMVI